MSDEVVVFQKGAKDQKTNKQNDNKNNDIKKKLAEQKEQGREEGAKEAGKQQEQAKELTQEDFHKQGTNEGIKEAAKEAEKNKEATEGKLESLIEKTKEPLLKIKTTGFINLIPDTLTIDPIKVSVTYRSFPAIEQVRSIFVKDILDVFVESIPFATAIRIVDNQDKENPLVIKPFKKEDAEKAKSIIMGLITANKENLDLTNLDRSEKTTEKVEQLGEKQS